ncbi:hypothetical protein N9B99_00755 [Candidatus Pelagibacter sp.]|nr:hypothetical protein [Candidatus Pelagibacter sp.]
MKKLISIIALGLLLSGNAYSRVIGIDQCIVDIGGFCIVETLISLLIVILVLIFLGWPIKKWIKFHIEKKSRENKKYKPGKVIIWFNENAGIFVLFIISIVLTSYFLTVD